MTLMRRQPFGVTTTLAVLLALGASLGMVACTTDTGTLPERGPGNGQGQAQGNRNLHIANKIFALASKPAKGFRPAWQEEKRNIGITNYTAEVGKPKKAKGKGKGGALVEENALEGTASAQVFAGPGDAHEIAFTEILFPVMSDLDNVCTVTDKTSGNTRTISADQEHQRFIVSAGGQDLTVIINPDGTYTVNGQPAADEKSAAKAIVATELGKTTSKQILVALYAGMMIRDKKVATLNVVNCESGNTYMGSSVTESAIDASPATRLVDAVLTELLGT